MAAAAAAAVEAHPVVAFVETDNASCANLRALFGELDIHLETVDAPRDSPLRASVRALAAGQSTLPAVFVRGKFIGGLNDGPEGWMGVTRLLATGRLHELINGSGPDAPKPTEFDYDLAVIGGGSGGLACAREAASVPGTRVVVFDFVKPSPQGSTWDIGGTCVNVGCIPKKLMHTAAIHGEAHHDAASFGWRTGKQGHDWATMVASVQKHIGTLNSGAKTSLRQKDVVYLNALGSFVNPYTVRATFGDGSTQDITARNIVVAVGGRPTPLPDCEGAEHAIDSDDIFSLKKSPGKTLCIGASYVALECAGFLTGLGYDTTVMVRSILLRGFDQDCANRLGAFMQVTGTKFIRSATPRRIEKLPDGRLRVHWRNANPGGRKPELPPGSEGAEIFDTVFAAVGRKADTAGLNLAAAGLQVNRWGKFPGHGRAGGDRESTTLPHVYALGDCLEGVPELTPAAIQAGQFLARRLFKGSKLQMPYELVATAVFTPLEYGNVGVSEDSVREPLPDLTDADKFYTQSLSKTYRSSRLKAGYSVYSKTFTPLEWAVAPGRPRGACYLKVICKGEGEKIVGVHFCGPNAGEVIQGFSLAVRLGASYDDLRATVGIHPTNAEYMTLVAAKPPKKAKEAAGAAAGAAGMAFDFSLDSNPGGDVGGGGGMKTKAPAAGPEDAAGLAFNFDLESNPDGDVPPAAKKAATAAAKEEEEGGGGEKDTGVTAGMTFDFDVASNPDGAVVIEEPKPAPAAAAAAAGMDFDFFGGSDDDDDGVCAT